MATNQILATFTVGAAAVRKGDVVKLASELLVIQAAVTDDVVGVMLDGAAISAIGTVVVFGDAQVIAGDAAINAGEYLMCHTTDGTADTHDGTAANPIIGMALESATVALQLIRCCVGLTHGAGPAA